MSFHIHDFKIIKPLGSTTKRKFNDVFLVEHKESGQKAVLKHLAKNSKNVSYQEKLKFEASLKFDHSNLPVCYLLHETDQELFVFKSYHEGIPLDQYWKSIPKKDRYPFLKLLIHALIPLFDELNKKKLIHSDIKPTNIIIHGSGLDFEVYLIDFGLAFYPSSVDRKIVFSLGYSAPELILNYLHLANHSSDIFSLGICIWQLLEGRLPLTHPNPAVMTNLQLTHPLPGGSRINKQWNRLLGKMCYKKNFHKPPNQLSKTENEQLIIERIKRRYQNLSEVYDELAHASQKMKPNSGFFKKLIKIFTNS